MLRPRMIADDPGLRRSDSGGSTAMPEARVRRCPAAVLAVRSSLARGLRRPNRRRVLARHNSLRDGQAHLATQTVPRVRLEARARCALSSLAPRRLRSCRDRRRGRRAPPDASFGHCGGSNRVERTGRRSIRLPVGHPLGQVGMSTKTKHAAEHLRVCPCRINS
jgi:hypothetical protein